LDDAVSVGLIINELITNSIRHGKVEGQKMEVFVHITVDKESMLHISVEDNGEGLFDEHITKKRGFGFELIETLSQSYDGSITLDKTKNRITVKLDLKLKYPHV
jgi:two-component sensor histidine kinase